MYAQLKTLHLNDIYKLQIAKMMYQFEHRCLPLAFNNLFAKLDKNYWTKRFCLYRS